MEEKKPTDRQDDIRKLAERFFRCVTAQKAEKLRDFFAPEACVRWYCSDEQFTAEEYIRANCEYPGTWKARVERVEMLPEAGENSRFVTVARVWSEEASFHVTSFFSLKAGRIESLDEYWGEDGSAPDWRRKRKLGRRIAKRQRREKTDNYVYILRCGDSSLYTGWTNDLKKRVACHQSGRGAKYTKSHQPVKLVYHERFDTKEEAMHREWEIKQMTRAQKEALLCAAK